MAMYLWCSWIHCSRNIEIISVKAPWTFQIPWVAHGIAHTWGSSINTAGKGRSHELTLIPRPCANEKAVRPKRGELDWKCSEHDLECQNTWSQVLSGCEAVSPPLMPHLQSSMSGTKNIRAVWCLYLCTFCSKDYSLHSKFTSAVCYGDTCQVNNMTFATPESNIPLMPNWICIVLFWVKSYSQWEMLPSYFCAACNVCQWTGQQGWHAYV